MDYESLLRVIKKRRTIRKFKPSTVPDEYIEKVIDAARWAPSAANTQPWEFVVVKNEEARKKMGTVIQKTAELTVNGNVPFRLYSRTMTSSSTFERL